MNDEHLKECEGHLRDIARRMVDAEIEFVNTLMEFGKIGRADAEHVFRFYVREKLVKLDVWMGRYSVKHGMYLDSEVIGRCVGATIRPERKRKAK